MDWGFLLIIISGVGVTSAAVSMKNVMYSSSVHTRCKSIVLNPTKRLRTLHLSSMDLVFLVSNPKCRLKQCNSFSYKIDEDSLARMVMIGFGLQDVRTDVAISDSQLVLQIYINPYDIILICRSKLYCILYSIGNVWLI